MITHTLNVEWSTANNAYVILFGNSIIGIDGKRFFQTTDELKDFLKPKGLTVKRNEITTMQKGQ